MDVPTTVTAALGSLRTAFDLVKLGVAARDDAKIRDALSAMAERLADANFAALEASERVMAQSALIDDLKTQLRDAQQRVREREDYVLQEVRPGAFVYAFRPKQRAGEAAQPGNDHVAPPHYLCQVCFDDGKKSVLQRSPNGRVLYCKISSAHNVVIADEPIMGTTSDWSGDLD